MQDEPAPVVTKAPAPRPATNAPGPAAGDAGASAPPDAAQAPSSPDGPAHDAQAASDLGAGIVADAGASDAPAASSSSSRAIDCTSLPSDLKRTNDVARCDRNLPRFYCDGKVVAILAVKPEVPFLLGMGPDMKNPMPGDLDVVRLYDRALTLEEIAAHARKQYRPCMETRGCQVELEFDESEGGAFRDTGPHGLRATIKGEVKTVPGAQGMAARFDGKGWVELPHHAATTFTKQYSFEAWIRTSGTCPPTTERVPCEFMRIFDKSNSLRLDRHAGGLRFQNTAHIFHGPGLENERGTWIHMAVTFDHERGVIFYKNGRESRSCRW